MTGDLNQPGVYVLYRDDVPYYIGKTSTTLLKRLRASNKTVRPSNNRGKPQTLEQYGTMACKQRKCKHHL
jgi:hypothetical protein